MTKEKFSPDLYRAIEKLKPHDHLCLIYENQEEQFNVAIPFIKMGLERHEKCVYIVDDNTFATIKTEMQAQGIKVNDAIKSNQLSIINKQDSYLKQGKFDPDWMIQFLKESVNAALAEGFSALRVTGEMTWALGDDPGNENLFEYESRLNKFFPRNASLAICQYNRNRFSPEVILNVIRTHPFVVYGGDIFTNYFFIPPDLFNTKDQPEQEVTQLLEGLKTLKQRETELISSEQRYFKKEVTLEKEQAKRKRAQEFLEESEKRYHGLFENMGSGVAVYEAVENGLDFIFKGFNAAAERIEKTPRKKVIGRKVTEVFPGIREMRLLEVFRRVWTTGKAEYLPTAIYKDKDLVSWRDSYVYRLTSGEIVAIYEDVTERKQQEQALAESENNFRWLYEYAPIAYLILTPEGIIKDVNRRWCQELEYSREEVLGREIFDFIVEEERKSAKILFKEKMKKRQTLVRGNERNYQTKAGAVKTFKIHDFHVVDQNQNITSIQTTLENITDRKQAEAEILANNERLRALTEILQHQSETVQDFLEYALTQALHLTKSKLGYIYFYNEEKKEFTLNTWSRSVMKECSVQDPQTVYQLEKTGFWGEAVRQRKPIIMNDYQASHPLKKGLPEGHAPLKNFMTVPVINNKKIEAVVGVANKPGDYNDTEVLQLTLLMGSVWKVVEQRLAEEALRGRESELRALFASMKDLVIIYSKEGRYLNIATTDFQMLIKPPEQLVGKTIHEVLPEDEADRWVGHIQMVLENQKTMPIEYSLEFDHQMIWFNALVSPLNKDSVIWVARDITAQKHVQEETHFLSIHDALTKLYNRTFFEEELSRLEKSRHFPVSIFMIDVDGLKILNDTQGHPAGDELLQRTARVLLESFRSEDMVARIGGDEFVAILPRTNAEAAQLALKRINHFLELNNKNKPNELKISIGMATSDQQAPLAETVKKADDRMYQDKRSKD